MYGLRTYMYACVCLYVYMYMFGLRPRFVTIEATRIRFRATFRHDPYATTNIIGIATPLGLTSAQMSTTSLQRRN